MKGERLPFSNRLHVLETHLLKIQVNLTVLNTRFRHAGSIPVARYLPMKTRPSGSRSHNRTGEKS